MKQIIILILASACLTACTTLPSDEAKARHEVAEKHNYGPASFRH
jgi:hypothetical protein